MEELIINIVVTVVVGSIIFYLGFSAKKPKLIIGGCGGGSGGGENPVHHENLSIRNDPGFFWFKLKRETAHIVHSYLKDKNENSTYVLRNNWYDAGSSSKRSSEILIDTGENEQIYLFVFQETGDSYYICGDSPGIINEDVSPRFSDSEKEFTLCLRDKIGREYRFNLMVVFSRQNNNQHLEIKYTLTLSRRLKMIKDGLSYFKVAFKFSRYS